MVWPFSRKVPEPPVAPPPSLVEVGETTMTPYAPGVGRVMTTDGGPHSHAAWAQVTAQHIAPLHPNLGGARYIQALKLQAAIAEALLPHHKATQDAERGQLSASHARLLAPLAEDHDTVETALAAVAATAQGTEWAGHFQDPEVLAAMRHELGMHYRTMQNIERSWHIDRHAHLEEFRSWAGANGVTVPARR